MERTGEWSAYFLDQKYGETSVEQPDSVPLLWNNRKNSVPLEVSLSLLRVAISLT